MELDSSKVRRPSKGFGWVDHRIVSGGHLAQMQQAEVAVYLLLSVVADRHGISYYSAPTLARLTKCSVHDVRDALAALAARDLIAICDRFVQVVDLDDRCPSPASTCKSPVAVTGLTGTRPVEVTADPASVVLGRLPVHVRDELLVRARQELAVVLGRGEPTQAVLEAVAAGILGREEPS